MTASNNGPGGPSLRVLVVEDEFLVAEHIAAMLEDLSHEVVGPVPTVEEAIALVESEPLDCALLDANLSGTDSGPIAAELKTRVIPFIVVTGYGNLELVNPDLETAPRLIKPVSGHALAAKLADLCGE